jgi:TrmH family RNA methyltransferase
VAEASIGARHPSIQRLRRLSRRRSSRREEGAFVIDGPTLLGEALRAGVTVDEVFIAPGVDGRVAEQAAAGGARVHDVREGVLEKATETVTSQGVASIARAHDVALSDALLVPGPVLVLAGVADPGNAGTLLRTAEAAGVRAVLFCGDAVDASAGSLFHLAVVIEGDAVRVLQELGAAGVRRFGTAAGQGTPYHAADLTGPLAIVLGGEAHGLAPEVGAEVDEWLTIPMAGRAESLNVGMAGAVLCFEALRQRGGA